MTTRRARISRIRNENFKLFKASMSCKSQQESEKFHFKTSFLPDHLDFSSYLENVKKQSQELEKGNQDIETEKKATTCTKKAATNPFMKTTRSLIGAVSSKDLHLLEEILGESNPAEIGQAQLNNALMFSITMREAPITERLLDAGANMHAFDSWYPVILTAIDIKASNIFDVLIKCCKDINVYGTILHSTVRTGDIKFVKKVVDLGVDVNLQCKANKSTPLHEAVKTVKFNGKAVLQAGFFSFNINKRKASQLEDTDASTVNPEEDFHPNKLPQNSTRKQDTAKNYDLDIISFLVSKNCNIDTRDIKGKTALHHACILGNKEVAEYLLKAGADPHIMDESNNIPVMYALNQNNTTLAKMLIKQDCLNKPIVGSQYYVHLTSKCGSVKCLEYLINNGADLTVKDSNDHGNTALMQAISHHASEEYVKCLLNQECAINETNTDGETAFSMLLSRYHSTNNAEMLAVLLLEAGADVNHIHPLTGMTQLMVYATDETVVECLLKYGADVNMVSQTGDNVLLKACESGNQDIVKMLFTFGMDISLTEMVNKEGNWANMTPLQLSMMNSDLIELTELLLCAGTSLRNMHQWVKESEHCKQMRANCSRFETVCKYIESTTRGPPKLSELCRMSVVTSLGPKSGEEDIQKLCLPATLKQELSWNAYLDIRMQELNSMREQV